MHHRLLVVALALSALLAPLTVSAQSTVELIVNDIDAYWSQQFANAWLVYTSPTLRLIEGPMTTSCGNIDPYFGPGAYCAADQTVYFSTAWAPNDAAAEIHWWTVLSHEWGHHVQWQTDTGVTNVLEAELQADCFAGAYMSYARNAGLVSPEAVSMALSLTQSAGDVWFFLPHDAPDHGNKAERALAFMNGMNGDAADCGFVG
ncbi:MAG TPA: neutral zinc metallopeptidase [Thermomicrobiales bacterium]|nr:neutral zinc metallopeptidase [Thermomicrobiales bacterium]